MKIIADIAAIEVKSIDENMDVVKDLNFDSFDLIDMIFKIERELNLENICDIFDDEFPTEIKHIIESVTYEASTLKMK